VSFARVQKKIKSINAALSAQLRRQHSNQRREREPTHWQLAGELYGKRGSTHLSVGL